MSVKNETVKKKGILNFIEKVGNALPHPATIFVILCGIIMVVSHVMAGMGVSVTYDVLDKATGQMVPSIVTVTSLLSKEGIIGMLEGALTNFTGFAPLGTVLVAMLGVGVAEGTGLIGTALRKLVLSTPKTLITVVVVLAGVISNIASDAGYVVLIPLGAIVFLSMGRHPMAGLAAAFAGVSGGFSANIIFGPTDALLAGISTEAAKISDASASVGIADNWYFLVVSTILIAIVGTIVTEKIVEPRLGEYKGSSDTKTSVELTTTEKKGLKYTGFASIVVAIILGITTIPQNALLRNAETGSLIEKSPLMNSIVIIIAIIFLVLGVAYGIGAGSIKNDKDIIKEMSKTMSTMGGYIVLVFFAAQFVKYFSQSNVGTVIAVKGADFLKGANIEGVPLILGFILVTAFINLFMGSASAKWAIMAPIFIPMLMGMGFAPEFTQMAYRIGDSSTNIISPLMTYFALIVSFSEKYDKESGIGTMISTMVPYSVAFLISWSVLLIVWMTLKLPLGPGATIFM